MGESKKPEVYLEVCTGFFRIPTDTVNYNITVMQSEVGAPPLGSPKVEPVAGEAVGQIDSVDDLLEQVDFSEESSMPELVVADNFYKQATIYFSGEFGRLTANLSTEAPHDQKQFLVSEAAKHFDKLQTLVDETKKSLEELTQTAQPESAVEASSDSARRELAEGLKGNVVKAKELVAEIAAAQISQAPVASEPPAPKVEKVKKKRYLFDLDVIFQTIYELCTNETVKEHSQAARAKAGEIFNMDTFLDAISPKAAEYVEDDGFYSVPMTDVFASLIKACNDKKTINLLKNMNKQQADIFLDQFLPLSIPPTEEIEFEVEGAPVEKAQAQPPESQESDPRYDQLLGIMDVVLGELDKLVSEEPEDKQTSLGPTWLEEKVAGTAEIVADMNSAIRTAVEDLEGVADHPGEGVSFKTNRDLQDAAMKMASCIVMKEENPALAFDDALGGDIVVSATADQEPAGHTEVEDLPEFEPAPEEELSDNLDQDDEFLETIVGLEEDGLASEADSVIETVEPQDTVAENSAPEELMSELDEEEDEFGEASQDDIDKLLESMGG